MVVRSATGPGEGATPAPARDDDMTRVGGEWEVQYLLPFLWAGFVPADHWAAHGVRLSEALAAGVQPESSVTDVVVAWPVAEQAYVRRLGAVGSAYPELGATAERFLADVRQAAVEAAPAVVHLVLDELVEMVWDDEDLAQYVRDLTAEAGEWDHPTGVPRGAVTNLPEALRAAEPERSFLLTGEEGPDDAPRRDAGPSVAGLAGGSRTGTGAAARPPGTGPSSVSEVTAALLALSGAGEHPIAVTVDGARVTGTWSTDLAGQTADGGGVVLAGSASWSWHVTLLDGGRYKASMSARNWPEEGGGFFTFSSRWVTGPMRDVLAEHGWQRRANPFTRAWRSLTGRS